MGVLIFILVLSFLVIIHELGHFLVAKRAGIKVHEFGLGYPPLAKALFKWRETLFTLNWIPFGGFVRMEGEDGENSEGGKQDDSGAFYNKSARARLAVILAGAAVNFVFGVIAFSIVFSWIGIPKVSDQPIIGQVSPDSPAALANIPSQVAITELRFTDKTVPATTINQVIGAINEHQGQDAVVVTTGQCQEGVCEDSHHEYPVKIRTEAAKPANQGLLGIAFEPSVQYQFYPWYEMPFRGAWFGLQQAVGLGMAILLLLGQLLTNLVTKGVVPQELAGPVGIADEAQRSGILQQGFLSILSFAGMLSINLAIMNVLPLPALDGGRALFILIEKVVGRRRISVIEPYANSVGYMLLVGMIILVTVRDIARIAF